ncbi:major facilitator superfamily domain-containing protein [Xylogone sp. PMI_703]|nr:major facilitator superfamily domain-containing protein [Xylogone sp. PMI_703]
MLLELDPAENPRNWHRWKKLIVSISPLLGALCITSSNSIYLAAIPSISEEFDVSTTLSILPITLFTIGLALGPVISASVSEIYGRRPVYIFSLLGALVFTAVGGSATNFRTLAVARFFTSFFGAPMVTIVIGTLNDVWDVVNDKTGSLFIGLFAAMMIWGTEIGPTIGQSILEDTGNWRWTFWLTTILIGVSCIVWLCPETYGPAIQRKKARKLGLSPPTRGNVIEVMKVALGRPLHMLVIEPIIFPTALISSIALCVVFFFYVAFPLIFQRIYSFTLYQTGLSFLSLFIGSIIGLFIMMILDKRKYRVAKAKAESLGLVVQPEERLYPVMLGGLLLPISLFWFAWTANESVHWVVPLLAGIPFGTGYFLVMLGWPLYKNDVYGIEFGASALAAENFMRYVLSAPVPLFSIQMIDRIGVHWSVSIAAFISLILVPIPWLIYKSGHKFRARSRYVQGRGVSQAADKPRESSDIRSDEAIHGEVKDKASIPVTAVCGDAEV